MIGNHVSSLKEMLHWMGRDFKCAFYLYLKCYSSEFVVSRRHLPVVQDASQDKQILSYLYFPLFFPPSPSK